MPTILYAILIVLLLAGALAVLNRLFDDGHKWKYRNPYDRTCSVCGRNEQEECWAEDFNIRGFNAPGTWEVYREGDPKKHEEKN